MRSGDVGAWIIGSLIGVVVAAFFLFIAPVIVIFAIVKMQQRDVPEGDGKGIAFGMKED